MSESLYLLIGIFFGFGFYYCKSRFDIYLLQRDISNKLKCIFSVYTGAAIIIGGLSVVEEINKNNRRYSDLLSTISKLQQNRPI